MLFFGGFVCCWGERTHDFAFVSLCYGRSREEMCRGYMPWPPAAECNMITNKQTLPRFYRNTEPTQLATNWNPLPPPLILLPSALVVLVVDNRMPAYMNHLYMMRFASTYISSLQQTLRNYFAISYLPIARKDTIASLIVQIVSQV